MHEFIRGFIESLRRPVWVASQRKRERKRNKYKVEWKKDEWSMSEWDWMFFLDWLFCLSKLVDTLKVNNPVDRDCCNNSYDLKLCTLFYQLYHSIANYVNK